MSKTSEQLYLDIEAIDADNRDEIILSALLKNLALVSAKIASGLESFNVTSDNPISEPSADSLYTMIEGINENDRDQITNQDLLKGLGLIFAKIGMETVTITGEVTPVKTKLFAKTVTLTSSSLNRAKKALHASITTTANHTTV